MTLEDLSKLFATVKDIAPWIAILLSSAALWLSIGNYKRDRAILRITSHFYQAYEHNPASLGIKIVNAGRRPIIITMWVGVETTAGWWWRKKATTGIGSYFADYTSGITLGERQAHRFTLQADELFASVGDGELIEIDDIWIEDTLGHKHKIKNIRENIQKLSNWKWPKHKNGQ